MPKGLNLKNFGRRKSSANALDFEPEAESAPAQSSFRVLERQDKGKITYGAPVSRPEKSSRPPFNSPLHALRGKSADDLGLYPNRGSGGTTNSGSSGYYDSSSASARYSSTSTLPSSVDQDHHHEEELFPARKIGTTGMYQNLSINADEPPAPPPSFSSRAARALSFGNNKGKSSKDIPPPVPVHNNGAPPQTYQTKRSQSPYRERAMTTSSYASTAVPAREELTLTSPDFGNDDFSSMFDSLKHESPLPPTAVFHRAESEPMFPPRTHSRNALTPSPNYLKLSREDNNASPYSQDDRDSNDGLMVSPSLSSPNTVDGGAPGPAVGNGITQAFNLGSTKSGYSRVPERYTSPGPERASISSYSSVMEDAVDDKTNHDYFPHRQAQADDEDRWVKRVELRDPPVALAPVSTKATTNTSSTATTRHVLNIQQSSSGSSRSGAVSPGSAAEESVFSTGSNATTPRAARLDAKEHSMSDASPNGPPSRAIRPLIHQRTESGTLKKMTPAQFKALQKHGNGNSAEHSDEEDLSDNDYDDEDEQERIKRLANQRRKQEANMSVYRQQMKKVTGGGPSDLPSSTASTVRPSMDRGSTTPAGGMAIHFGGIGGAPPPETLKGKPDDEEDDDVPLGILQAHGFPSVNRPPTRQDNDLHQRRTSAAGSIVNGGAGQGSLPPFARRLPADPYFGAGLVNQSTRESLALNNSTASMMAVPSTVQPMVQHQQQPPAPPMPQASPMGHPGGLVGVIAGEERAKAARRGSPNTGAGGYNTMGNMPLPSNMNMPPMPRANSMGNLAPPSVYAPSGVPPLPLVPHQFVGMGQMPMMPQMQQVAGQNQQVMDMMQMQMQLMQNMLQMQNMQLGTPGAQTPGTPATMQQQQQGQQQQQPGDYLGVNFGDNRPVSVASQATGYGPPLGQNNGRAMTMMNLPSSWTQPPQLGGPRPNSAMPLQGSSYAPSVNGLNVNGGGPGNGYTPSIAPSERSNVGMPSRYRPVTRDGETSRSQSMTSSLTLNAFAKQQTSPNLPGTPFNGTQAQTPKSTIRVVDKAKGAPNVQSRQVDDDEEDAWADMKKKREEKKRFKWGKKSNAQSTEPTLNDLYQGLE